MGLVDVGGAVGLREGEVEEEEGFEGVVEWDPGILRYIVRVGLDGEGSE